MTFQLVICITKLVPFLCGTLMNCAVPRQREIRVTHGSSITVLMSLQLALEDIRLRSRLTQLQRTSFLSISCNEISDKFERWTSVMARWLRIHCYDRYWKALWKKYVYNFTVLLCWRFNSDWFTFRRNRIRNKLIENTYHDDNLVNWWREEEAVGR